MDDLDTAMNDIASFPGPTRPRKGRVRPGNDAMNDITAHLEFVHYGKLMLLT